MAECHLDKVAAGVRFSQDPQARELRRGDDPYGRDIQEALGLNVKPLHLRSRALIQKKER